MSLVERAVEGAGPLPCVRDGGAPCGEDVVLRGTTTYCATCGQMTGVATVAMDLPDDATEEDHARAWEDAVARWRDLDLGTVVEWRLETAE